MNRREIYIATRRRGSPQLVAVSTDYRVIGAIMSQATATAAGRRSLAIDTLLPPGIPALGSSPYRILKAMRAWAKAGPLAPGWGCEASRHRLARLRRLRDAIERGDLRAIHQAAQPFIARATHAIANNQHRA